MAVSINITHVGGYLGADPEVRKTGNSGEVVQLSIATTERWGGSGRDAQERTEWHRVVCFTESQINYADKYLRKGDPVFVTGKLQTRRWKDKDDVERFTTEIVAFSIQGLSSGGGGSDRGSDDRGDGRGGSDRGGRDDRGGGRGGDRDGGRGGDRGGSRDRETRGGRDDRGGSRDGGDRGGDRGHRDDRGGGRDDRGGARGGAREEARGGDTRSAADLDDEIPF